MSSAAAVALMGTTLPAHATSLGEELNDACQVTGQNAEHLAEQVCNALAESAVKMDMGKADVTANIAGPSSTQAFRLSTYLFSQHFEKGWLVYSMDTGEVTPMSDEVYEFWAHPESITFEANLNRLGIPCGYRLDSAPNLWHQGTGITTIFRQNDGSDRFLQYVPSTQSVMDFTADYAGESLSWSDSLIVGRTPAEGSSLVARGLDEAGFTPHTVGYEDALLSPTAGNLNLAYQLENHLIALPAGTPWVINVNASALDAQDVQGRQETLENARTVAKQLQEVYPYSRIVFHGVLTSGKETQINEFNDQLKRAVTEEGARFVDTSGWISEYSLKPYLLADGHSLNEEGQQKIACEMKWAIRYAIYQF